MPLYTSTFANLNVTSNALGEVTPSTNALIAWTHDPVLAYNSTLLTNGTVYLSAVYAQRAVSVTKLHWWVTTAGATPTAGQNEVGLYNSSGTRLAATNVDADISSTGMKSTTITSQALTAGSFYWVAMVFNAATAPTVARSTAATQLSSAVNLNLTAATFRFATNGTSQTALPSSITPSSNTAPTFGGPWVAVAV
jgi:hypothetical protein